MNPVFVFLVILIAAFAWLMCSFLFRLIGMIADKLIRNAKKAIDDEPSNAEMFVKGFGASFKKRKSKDKKEENK